MNTLLIVGLILGAPGVKEPPKKAEVPAIVGEWEAVELVAGGRVLTPAQVARRGDGLAMAASAASMPAPRSPATTRSDTPSMASKARGTPSTVTP